MKVKTIILCGLMAAVTGICSQILIPLPMVPINLAIFAVLVAGAYLGAAKGAVSMVVYTLMAAVGIPVMAGFSGGIGLLMGKTGGYVIGYIFCAAVAGALAKMCNYRFFPMCLGMAAGVLVCYIFGTIWFIAVTGMDVVAALTYCVIPFLAGDVVKIILAAFLTRRLRKSLPSVG